ncbi:MAG: hypothetical protein CVU43_04560 [Chloroflexi bacterium HGW-Chloroflexi-5]|nr:MAG: hypothetical protein CVU43_04560 [Chloroflexi bacterium HGW-Chloroflexi-5]
MSEEQKAWKCKNGHVIGQVRKAGNGIHQLLLYRQAVDFEGEPEEVDVMAVVEGTVLEIRCGICGEVRTWVTGQEALDKLIASYGKLIKQTA